MGSLLPVGLGIYYGHTHCRETPKVLLPLQSLDEARTVVCTRKANGEAAHLSSCVVAGRQLICVGSKNVHMLIRNRGWLPSPTFSLFWNYRLHYYIVVSTHTLPTYLFFHSHLIIIIFIIIIIIVIIIIIISSSSINTLVVGLLFLVLIITSSSHSSITIFLICIDCILLACASSEDIELYSDQRFTVAREVGTTVMDLIESMEGDGRQTLLDFLTVTSYTGIFEILNPGHQHVEDLSHLSK